MATLKVVKPLSSFIRFPWIMPLFIFVFLMVMGALAHPLWSDEAETAFFGRTILQKGVPYGFDGTNVTGIENGIVLNEDLINHRSPWGQYYLTAFSFAIFGESSFAARLPFIILSGFSLILIYYLALKISVDKTTAFITSLIASLAVTLILYSFQDRYYSMVILFGMAQVLTSFSLIEPIKKKINQKAFFVFSGILLAYSNYAIFAIFSLSLFFVQVLTIISRKKLRKSIWVFIVQFILFQGIALSFFIPWLLIFKPASGESGSLGLSWELISQTVPAWFGLVFSYFNDSIFPVYFWAIGGIIVGIKIYRKESIWAFLFTSGLILSYFLFFALLDSGAAQLRVIQINPFDREVAINQKFAEVRYHIIVIPLFVILVALILRELKRVSRYLFLGVLVLYLITKGTIFPEPRSILAEYVGEITNPYPVADERVADYLKVNAKDGETAFINSNRAHEPVMFLLGGKKIKFVNRIHPVNRRIFPKNYKTLPKYIYNFKEDPDWVILYSNHSPGPTYYDFDMRDFDPLGRVDKLDLKDNYSLTILPIFYGSDVARPEIESHQFKKIEPKYDEQVFIYKKKSKSVESADEKSN